jgi:hypothetical protein
MGFEVRSLQIFATRSIPEESPIIDDKGHFCLVAEGPLQLSESNRFCEENHRKSKQSFGLDWASSIGRFIWHPGFRTAVRFVMYCLNFYNSANLQMLLELGLAQCNVS